MLKWLEMVRKRESGELTKPQQPVVPISRRGPDKEYSRYKQEDFKATGITGSFNIDTRGTNASKSFNSLVAGNKRFVINCIPDNFINSGIKSKALYNYSYNTFIT